MSIPTRHSGCDRSASAVRTFFVTSSIFEKKSLLQSQRAASLFIEVLYDYRRQGKFLIHDFVVMPDHFHVLITVGSELSIERAMQFIKGGFAFRAGREFGFRSPVWQRGFSENRVLTGAQFLAIRHYIRENPVTRRLAEHACEFAYSSASSSFELDPVPPGLKPGVKEALVGTPEGVP